MFLNRLGGNGIYILDEPEAGLSPIILAYPDSVIYEIKEDIKEVKYEETEHFQVVKAFVNNPKKMLEELL